MIFLLFFISLLHIPDLFNWLILIAVCVICFDKITVKA